MDQPTVKPLLYPFVGLALMLGAASAEAATYEQRLIAQLVRLGYSDIALNFTLLGRAQITAVSKTDTREIVLNPRTGEILRDYSESIESDGVAAAAIVVAPIVLPPEPEVVVSLPPEAEPVILPADVVPDPLAGIPLEVLEEYLAETLSEPLSPQEPGVSSPADATETATTSDPADNSGGAETTATGAAP